MPSLVICGHRTFVAGDDLRTFTFFAILLRLLQIIVLIPFTVITAGSYHIDDSLKETCGGGSKRRISGLIDGSYAVFITYICTSYVMAFAGLFLEISIWRTGSKGTPAQPEKRACLKPLCNTKMIPMSVFRIGNLILGIMVIVILRQICYCDGRVSDPYIICPNFASYETWLSILIVSHFLEAAAVGVYSFYFLSRSKNKYPSTVVKASQREWQCCCRCCCTATSLLTCCLYGGRDGTMEDYADIAMVLSDFFDDGGTLDIVPSDIVIGLRMLTRVQREKQLQCRDELVQKVSFLVGEIEDEDVNVSGSADVQHGSAENIRSSVSAKEVVNSQHYDETLGVDKSWIDRIRFVDAEMGGATMTDDTRIVPEEASKYKNDDGDNTVVTKPALEPKPTELDPTIEKIMDEQENCDNDDDDDAILLAAADVERLQALLEGDEEAFEGQRRRRSIIFPLQHGGDSLYCRPTVRVLLSRKNSEDRLAIAEGARFMRIAMGIYSFRVHIAKGRSCEVVHSICNKGRNCIKQCCDKANDANDGNLQIGAGIQIGSFLQSQYLALSGLDATEIVYVQFGEGVARTPYCIAVDHAWKSVVISIRGTEGLDDVVADLRMVPVSMEDCGSRFGFDGTDCFVHAGMFACAEWIYNDLESHGILESLLSKPHLSSFDVRLTGHSLGAGTAAILSFMMRSKYPTLRCHCFCPPGCTLSEKMTEMSKEYVTSYVLDHDIVPRLSFEALEHLRNGMLDAISRMKVTKYQGTHAEPMIDTGILLHPEDNVPPSKFREEFDEFLSHRFEWREKREIMNAPLYPPGKIVQLVRTEDDQPPPGCCSARNSPLVEEKKNPYAARWAHRNDLSEIVISSHFLDDHSSPNILRELERKADSFGISAPYTIQKDTST